VVHAMVEMPWEFIDLHINKVSLKNLVRITWQKIQKLLPAQVKKIESVKQYTYL